MKELIDLYKLIQVAEIDGEVVDPQHVAAFNGELGTFGYTLTKEAMATLGGVSERALLQCRDGVMKALEVPNYTNHTLFGKFPYKTPDQWSYLAKRILSVKENEQLRQHNAITILSCGHAIHAGMFNLSEFGCCPVCEQQVPELNPNISSKRYEFENVCALKPLNVATGEILSKLVKGLLSRSSSLSATEKSFIKQYGLPADFEIEGTVFKETLPFIFAHSDADVSKHVSGMTDMLRIAYYMSDDNADLSLKLNQKFKLSTSTKKRILRLMEASVNENSAEDLKRYRERWLRLAKTLAVGSKVNRAKYPKVAALFDILRNDAKSIETYNSFAEKHVREWNFTKADLERLAQRPAEYARRLDFLLRTTQDGSDVLSIFRSKVAGNLTTKLLFELTSAFRYRMNGLATGKRTRAFFPKGNVNSIKVIEDKRVSVNENFESDLYKVLDILSDEITTRKFDEPAMGKVYIDESLKGVLVPFNRRGDSAATEKMLKGSRYAFEHNGIIRAFIYWKDHSDVDLSVVCFNDAFDQVGHVAFTNLSDAGMQHSGDVRSAPNGGAEYIDIDITKLNKGVRYVAMSIILYSGAKSFEDFECFAGVMKRDKLKSGEKFEPASVSVKFDVNSTKTSVMPIMIDVLTNEIIYLDMGIASGRYGAVQDGGFKEKIEAMASLKDYKPTLMDILSMTARARGEIVTDIAEADVVYTLETDIDQILSDCGF